MRKFLLAGVVTLLLTPASAQTIPSGQRAGGPRQVGIPGELGPGERSRERKPEGRGYVRSGQAAGGPGTLGYPGEARPVMRGSR